MKYLVGKLIRFLETFAKKLFQILSSYWETSQNAFRGAIYYCVYELIFLRNEGGINCGLYFKPTLKNLLVAPSVVGLAKIYLVAPSIIGFMN